MSEKADYELCTRVEDVHLPKSGVFGISAATGGLAGIEHYELTALFLFNQSFTYISGLLSPSCLHKLKLCHKQ